MSHIEIIEFISLTDPRVSSIRKLLRLIFCQPRRTVRRGSAIKYYTQILELRKALKRLLNWGDLDDIQNSFPRPISPTLGEQLVPPPEHFSDADLELLEQFLHAYDKATDRPSEHPNHLRNKKATRALLDEIYQSSQLTRSPIRKQHRARNENRHFGPVTNLTKFMLNIPTIAPLTGQSKHLTMP